MVVVGPEDPLVKGIYLFQKDEALKNIPVIRPSKAGCGTGRQHGEFTSKASCNAITSDSRLQSITAANLEEGLAFLETLEARTESRRSLRRKRRTDSPTLEEAKKELKKC